MKAPLQDSSRAARGEDRSLVDWASRVQSQALPRHAPSGRSQRATQLPPFRATRLPALAGRSLPRRTYRTDVTMRPNKSTRVSGRSRTKTYGKDYTGTCGTTCPRRSLFGKDTDKTLRIFKGLRIMLSPIEPLFSGKLSHMTIA